jgi:hypothetical protein
MVRCKLGKYPSIGPQGGSKSSSGAASRSRSTASSVHARSPTTAGYSHVPNFSRIDVSNLHVALHEDALPCKGKIYAVSYNIS